MSSGDCTGGAQFVARSGGNLTSVDNRLIGSLVVALSLAAIGCRQPDAPPAVPPSVQKAPPEVHTRALTEAELGLPFYPGSTEVGKDSKVMETERDKTAFSNRSTKDSPKKVADFYYKLLKDGKESSVGKGMLVGGVLNDHSVVQIEIMPAGMGQTQVGVTVHTVNKK